MNPFELPGPLFLIFFALMGTVLLAGLLWVRRSWEPDPTIPVHLTDPYEIACLRGGTTEVLRLATTGLIDRGLLEVDGQQLKVANQDMAKMIRHPVERAILDNFWTGNDVTSLFARESLRHEGEKYETLLQQRGLIADKDARIQQLLTSVGSIGVLWVTAITKVELAIERGYSYGFLVVLAIGFSIASLALSIVRKTRRGEHFLKDMEGLFTPLRNRAGTFVPKSNTDEAVLLAAVFGTVALPSGTYPYVKQLFAQADQAAGGGSGCGSSCGSGCGGGCAGGCGGCGS
jgi:uncharacterized protein (TIGR04222 family)